MKKTKILYDSKPKSLAQISQDIHDIKQILANINGNLCNIVEVLENFRYTYWCLEKGYDNCLGDE